MPFTKNSAAQCIVEPRCLCLLLPPPPRTPLSIRAPDPSTALLVVLCKVVII